MARGKTLEWILNGVRAEARMSLNPAANVQVRESHILLIQREQQRLWEDFAWPHLRVYRQIPLQAGQYQYGLPNDVSMDRVEKIDINDGGRWRPLRPEITDYDLEIYQTDLGERSWPVQAWRADENDQVEVWPIPEQNADPATLEGNLRVTAIRNLNPLVDDGDRADLDDRLLILYVAGGLLAAAGATDAQLKIEAANKLYLKLKGHQTKSKSFNMFSTTTKTVSRLGRGPRPYMTR
ncbi:hypothetical protein XM25_00600 [Devosia sp. H5989]|nr:hypothetical protein XM25_00600 [Devosia sp. H5989]